MSLADGRVNVGAVVFDCDGVLVDSETINNEVLAELATKAGVPTTFEECAERYMGRSTVECVAEIESALGRSVVGFDLATAFEERVLERVGELRPIPGVIKLLGWLDDKRIPVCVASSGTPKEIRQRLVTTQLADYFGPHVYSASMVKRGKPAPDLFNYAAENLGVPPEKCLLIEDSPYGVRGGKEAGMQVIGFAAIASIRSLREAGADIVHQSMHEIQATISTMIRHDRATSK